MIKKYKVSCEDGVALTILEYDVIKETEKTIVLMHPDGSIKRFIDKSCYQDDPISAIEDFMLTIMKDIQKALSDYTLLCDKYSECINLKKKYS